ncbi:uncharacterized protein LOC125578145 [Brassica napus]|uniref:uncharacterized protein LOC125578145 n=1 Tax=Brassica napus TaxID=3708 RepID=UPI0020785F8B|nr:uncharacterized protein LOC125578145 [Brassica napus]
MALAVVTSARKLRPYFQSHTIEVLSNQPLRTVMQNTNQSGRLTKWAMELSEHDIVYKNRTATKSQVLADFLIELTPELEQDLILPTSNNEAEYESLIAGLRLAKAVKAKRISAYCDSQLVVPRGENVCADALAALGSKLHDQVKRTIPIHKIEKPSIDTKAEQAAIAAAISEAMDIDEAESPSQDDQPTDWRKELIDYLAEDLLPAEKWDARRLKRRSAHYVFMDGELHRWTATKVLLKCIASEETRLVMAETHEGAAGNHSGGQALALKVKNLGFYWPTMNADCETYARKCDKCQRHATTIHSPTEFLHTLTAPYPFMRWGMDIIGPMPASRQKKFILVLTDYFTKWVEAEAYASITDKENNSSRSDEDYTLLDGLRLRGNGSRRSERDESAPIANATKPELNRDMLLDALDDIEKKRHQALLRIQNYQHQIESYYNKKVKSRPLEMGNLVLRKVFENTKEWNRSPKQTIT